MNVKEAVKAAKDYVALLFAEEQIFNLGLEEVEKEDYSGNWKVTIGFSRPWDKVKNPLVGFSLDQTAARAYRVVTVCDADGSVQSVRLHEK